MTELPTLAMYVQNYVREAHAAVGPISFLVANPTDKPLESAVVTKKTAALFQGQALPEPLSLEVLDAETGKRRAPCQLDRLAEGAELALNVSNLGARQCSTFIVFPAVLPDDIPPVYRVTPTGFEVNNGVLKLVKDNAKSGNAFDRISLRGLELGRFTPLVHQATGQNLWVGPERIEKVEPFQGLVRLVLDITFARGPGGGGETKTQVDTAGKPAAAQTRERQFRCKYRFIIEPGRAWLSSQLIWIENTDTAPWELAEYYHYLPSNIGGSDKNDEARGNYWFNPATKMCLGIVPGSRDLAVNFWKDGGGQEHPDARRKLDSPSAGSAVHRQRAACIHCRRQRGCLEGDAGPPGCAARDYLADVRGGETLVRVSQRRGNRSQSEPRPGSGQCRLLTRAARTVNGYYPPWSRRQAGIPSSAPDLRFVEGQLGRAFHLVHHDAGIEE